MSKERLTLDDLDSMLKKTNITELDFQDKVIQEEQVKQRGKALSFLFMIMVVPVCMLTLNVIGNKSFSPMSEELASVYLNSLIPYDEVYLEEGHSVVGVDTLHQGQGSLEDVYLDSIYIDYPYYLDDEEDKDHLDDFL